ncbi:MAG: UDP-3-O-(3-hydroxymyristoyl)glucosamine N-acyltransferase, partial [Planctomycetota bacterium]|nr:UDP-3-O-(3-hydroxymyristoyl)glucosamine N-acyltransferase [Planctomycetota bacterium]
MPEITLREMAERLAGTVVGDPELKVNHIAGLAEAGPGALTFLTNPRYENLLRTTRATAAIVDRQPRQTACALIQTDNPDLAFARAAALFLPPPPALPPGIHP